MTGGKDTHPLWLCTGSAGCICVSCFLRQVALSQWRFWGFDSAYVPSIAFLKRRRTEEVSWLADFGFCIEPLFEHGSEMP